MPTTGAISDGCAGACCLSCTEQRSAHRCPGSKLPPSTARSSHVRKLQPTYYAPMLSQPIASTEFVQPITPIGVLVVDDQYAVREGLARLIACAPMALRYVVTAATTGEALSTAARLHPDIVILDVDLAGDDGLALIPQLSLTSGVLVLTSHGDAATRARAKRLGARAFIEKHQPAADLLGSIAEICRLPMRNEGEETPGRSGTSSPLPMVPSSDEKTSRHS